MRDARRDGRPGKVSDKDALWATKLYAKGEKLPGSSQRRPWRTLEAAVAGDGELAALMQRCACSARTLKPRMREVHPALRRRTPPKPKTLVQASAYMEARNAAQGAARLKAKGDQESGPRPRPRN